MSLQQIGETTTGKKIFTVLRPGNSLYKDWVTADFKDAAEVFRLKSLDFYLGTEEEIYLEIKRQQFQNEYEKRLKTNRKRASYV